MAQSPGCRRRPNWGWINSSIAGIGLASLLADLCHEMATAALPTLLGALGSGSAALGFIEATADGLSSAAKIASGMFGDRLKRKKPLAVCGYALTALGMAGFAWARKSRDVFLARAAGWVGRGARGPVRNALLADATTPETYGRAFGLERAMDSTGAVLGPALVFLFLGAIGLKAIFWISGALGLLAAMSFGFLVREKDRPDFAPRASRSFGFGALPAAFKRYLAGVGLAGSGDFSKTLLILWAGQAWAGRYGALGAARLAMIFYAGGNAVHAASCYLSGMLADRFPKRRLLALGYAAGALPALALLIPGASILKFSIVFGFSGLYGGLLETVEKAAAAEMMPPHLRSSGFGLLAAVNGIGDAVSSAMAGILWVFSPVAAVGWTTLAFWAGAAVLLF
ncbi:MAG: MFS transporter [Elusimicrobiota bacterium]